jgi:DHA1 family multidrug resistance protein-like MFS transporter
MLSISFLEPLRRDKRLGALLVMICLVMAGNGLVSPVLSLYALTFQVATSLVGMLITMFGIGRVLANYPAGHLSQSVGRRPLLCTGALVLGVSSAGAALASDFTTLVAWRFVQGFGSGIYMTVSMAALIDRSAPGTRAHMLALYQTAMLFGASIGPGIGGLLAHRFGYAAPFWAYMIVALGALATALLAFRDRPDVVRRDKAAGAPAAGPLLSIPFVAICVMTGGVFFTRTASLFLLFPLIGSNTFGLSVDIVGAALTAGAFGNFCALPFAGSLINRFGARSVTAWTTLATACGLTIAGLAPNVGWYWFAVFEVGLASGLNSPAASAFATEVIPPERLGPGVGMLRTVGDIGFVAGPIVVGLVIDAGFGYGGGVAANVALLLAVTTGFVLSTRTVATQELVRRS